MCDGLCSLLHGGRSINENFLAVQKLLNLRKASQELISSPKDSTKIEAPDNWPSKGGIEFKDVDLRYRPDLDLVLKGLSFKV